MSEPTLSQDRSILIDLCARAAHEANRSLCLSTGDVSQLPYEDAPDWQRDSARKGVEGVLAGNGPAESHASWLAEKEATGWTYGEVKDPEAKTHPCMVPYEELPPAQQRKDHVFVAVVRAAAHALGLPVPPQNLEPVAAPPAAEDLSGLGYDELRARWDGGKLAVEDVGALLRAGMREGRTLVLRTSGEATILRDEEGVIAEVLDRDSPAAQAERQRTLPIGGSA